MPLAEVILWNRLKGRQLEGYKFRRQYSIEHFVIDFYCAELRLAVEVDGDSHYIEGMPLYDIARQNKIEAFGVKFLRFTNEDIYENLEGVLLKIVERIKQITSPRPSLSKEGIRNPPLTKGRRGGVKSGFAVNE